MYRTEIEIAYLARAKRFFRRKYLKDRAAHTPATENPRRRLFSTRYPVHDRRRPPFHIYIPKRPRSSNELAERRLWEEDEDCRWCVTRGLTIGRDIVEGGDSIHVVQKTRRTVMKTCQRKQSWSLQSWELFQSYLTSLEDFPCELVVPEGYDIVTATVEDLLSFVSGSHAGIS